MSAADDSKAYASVHGALALVEALAGAVPLGLPNKALAEAARITPAQVTRLAAALIAAGWVKKLDSGHYCINAHVGRLAFKVLASFEAAERQLADQRHNYINPNP